MASQRFFQDGENLYQGYTIVVNRFTSAYENGDNSRIAAKHWGIIRTPSGEEISLVGKTTNQIKKMITRLSGGGVAYSARDYARGGESSELKQLIKAKETLESLGMNTDELDAKIEAKKAEIEANRNRVDNTKQIKAIRKEITKMEKAREQMIALGCSTSELDSKIAALEEKIDLLS
jgi:predicted RNase H-like nuclease (RuvC/YqgF family)